MNMHGLIYFEWDGRQMSVFWSPLQTQSFWSMYNLPGRLQSDQKVIPTYLLYN